MINRIVAICLIGTVLAGCKADEVAAAKYAAPEVTNVGTFDGCEVKYVDRGYQINSFYLAKCASTATLTQNYIVQQGKASVFQRRTQIIDEVEKLKKEQQQLDDTIAVLKAKLTPEELSALGLSK